MSEKSPPAPISLHATLPGGVDEAYRRVLEAKAARLVEGRDLTGIKPIDLIPTITAASRADQKDS